MRNMLFVVLFVFVPSFAFAKLEIEPLTGSARFEKRLEAMRSSVSARSVKAPEFPTFEQFNEAVSKAKFESGRRNEQVVLESPSRTMIEKLGCKLENQAPSGVEKKGGGLNGVMSVYLCANSYLVSYESDYKVPLTQKVIIFDDDYVKKQERGNPLIKEAVATRGNTRFTSIRWLNADNEIKYEIFADLGKSNDAKLEKSLKDGLKEIAIKLSPVE